MQLEVAGAVGADDGHPRLARQGRLQLPRGCRRLHADAEQLRGPYRIETAWRAEQSFELGARERLGLWKEVEYPAPGVVDDDQTQLRHSASGRKAAEIVEEGEVAKHGPGSSAAPSR